jgi:hypothetical protein
MDKRPLKVFLCHAHIIPLWDADTPVGALRCTLVRALYSHLTKDGVDAQFDKAKRETVTGRKTLLETE